MLALWFLSGFTVLVADGLRNDFALCLAMPAFTLSVFGLAADLTGAWRKR